MKLQKKFFFKYELQKKGFGSDALRNEKLSDSNYHIEKQKIELVLAYRVLQFAIFKENQFPRGSFRYEKWKQCNKLPRVINGPSLFDKVLKLARDC